MREIKFKKLTTQIRDRFYKNKLNLDIADKNHKLSYFNLTKKYIRIETLTLNDNYTLKNIFYKIFNTETYLIVHISDNTIIPTRLQIPQYLMNIKEEINDIKNCTTSPITIQEVASVNVVVFNDNNPVSCSMLDEIITSYLTENNPTKKFDALPNEAGGGVIVKGP